MNRDQALTATLDEIRDALAEMDGWKTYNEGVPDDGACHISWWRYTIDAVHGGRTWNKNHPHPPTLDGADAAMPEGWWWSRLSWASKVWTAGRGDEPASVEVPDTGDKIADLYRLAVLCCLAGKETGK